MSIKMICLRLAVVMAGIFGWGITRAQQHSYYLKALPELRGACWMLQHKTGNWVQGHDEKEALREMNEVILEIKEAAIDDGKDMNDHPEIEESTDHAGRLRQCIEFLKRAKDDLSREKDDQFAKGLRGRTIKHCDEAIRFAGRAARA